MAKSATTILGDRLPFMAENGCQVIGESTKGEYKVLKKGMPIVNVDIFAIVENQEYQCDTPGHVLGSDRESQVFRLAREAVQDYLRHANDPSLNTPLLPHKKKEKETTKDVDTEYEDWKEIEYEVEYKVGGVLDHFAPKVNKQAIKAFNIEGAKYILTKMYPLAEVHNVSIKAEGNSQDALPAIVVS